MNKENSRLRPYIESLKECKAYFFIFPNNKYELVVAYNEKLARSSISDQPDNRWISQLSKDEFYSLPNFDDLVLKKLIFLPHRPVEAVK